MAQGSGIIGLAQWLRTPAGRYVLEWEQGHLDAAVADLFGYHALQLGMPELQALRANRMPHRWVATAAAQAVSAAAMPTAAPPAPASDPCADTDPGPRDCADVALHCDFDALPFDSQSL
ncbi:MAG: SAM-dependent methyltransferase, partial [Burkholderiaceae bacterium]